MAFALVIAMSAMASVDAVCLDSTGMCSSVPSQEHLMLQTDHRVHAAPDLLQVFEASGCSNRDGNCDYYASLGYCTQYPDHMGKECAKSCGKCGGGGGGSTGCRDLDGACAYYKQQGYCSSSAHVRSHCQKTCGACSGGGGGGGGGGSCRNNDGHCDHYASLGYCTQYRQHMAKECAKSCGLCGGSAPAPPPPSGGASGGGATIKVVSYNLFWWNAFDQNPSKSSGIIQNIKNMQADTIGLQECNNAGTVTSRTGNLYSAVSPFNDNQGVMVKPGVFSVLSQGSRNLQARGKWGPRFVNWVKLRHSPSGSSFWHFNTHWCVHSGNGHHCDANVRHTGAKNMLQAIRQVAGSSPVVITGDFNAGMGEHSVQEFTRNGFVLAKNSGVDAILYSQGHWSVVSASTGSAAGSDHSPVIVTLQLRR